jgi:hypothetical protein
LPVQHTAIPTPGQSVTVHRDTFSKEAMQLRHDGIRQLKQQKQQQQQQQQQLFGQ